LTAGVERGLAVTVAFNPGNAARLREVKTRP